MNTLASAVDVSGKNLPYDEQLKAKQQQVYDQLSRIGKVELPEFRPIMGSVHTKEYRINSNSAVLISVGIQKRS